MEEDKVRKAIKGMAEEEGENNANQIQDQGGKGDTTAKFHHQSPGPWIASISGAAEFENQPLRRNTDYDLFNAQLMAYQGPMTTLLMQQTWSSSQEEEIMRNTREDTLEQSWMQMYNTRRENHTEYTTSANEAAQATLQESSETGGNSNFSFSDAYYEETQEYFADEGFKDFEFNSRNIFDSMQVQQVHSTSLSRGNNTCALSRTSSWGHGSTSEGNEAHQTTDDQRGQEGGEEITEQDIDEFLQSEQQAAAEGNNAPTDSKCTPQIGMEFRTKEDAQHFFSIYGDLAGFEIVITHTTRTQSQKKNREIYKQEYRCHKYGKEPKKKTEVEEEQEMMNRQAKKKGDKRNSNIQVKTNCPVVMEVKLEGGCWKVVRLELDHNHELNPGSTNLFRGRKYMTDMEKAMIRTLSGSNIPTRKMIAVLSYLRGHASALPYQKKDVQNERTKIYREVSGNDMNKVMQYFQKRQADDATFYYKFEVNDENKVKNIYWRDGISLEWYAQYGDCVSFDATYMTNRYNLPFTPIVGISGHAHTLIFGCAFVSEETTEAFEWIFEAFLESMGGKHPKTIITDQDKAMRAAIALVMPETVHRNCLFHIKKKCYTNNGKCFAANEKLPQRFEDAVDYSVTVEEFEALWQKMILDFKLEQNRYFTYMWENRARFIPVYFKNNFYPFLQSTNRSEQTNSRFKDNVGPTYSVLSFLEEYQRIIERISIMERDEDNHSKQKRPKELQTGYKIELQAAELYNRNIFLKFQFQLKLTERLKYKQVEAGKRFEVWHKTNRVQQLENNRKYIVQTDLTKGEEEFSCICAKFDKDGILCCHILKVIVEEEIDEIPEKYILDRWRKKECKMIREYREETPATNELLRFNYLSRKATVITSKGSKSEEMMTYLDGELDRIEKEMDEIAKTLEEQHFTEDEQGGNDASTQLQDPERIKNKGRPKKPTRLMDIVEEIKRKNAQAAARRKTKAANSSPTSKSKKKQKKTVQDGGQDGRKQSSKRALGLVIRESE